MGTFFGQEYGKVDAEAIFSNVIDASDFIIWSTVQLWEMRKVILNSVLNQCFALFNTVFEADIVKMLESQPDLTTQLRRVRGGYLKIQGTWMPYEVRILNNHNCIVCA